jgi:hypothetical protein
MEIRLYQGLKWVLLMGNSVAQNESHTATRFITRSRLCREEQWGSDKTARRGYSQRPDSGIRTTMPSERLSVKFTEQLCP